MPRTSEEYNYSVEMLSNLSGWPVNRIHQDAARKSLKVGDLAQAAIWLAANGNPELRAEMARKLVPVVLGTHRDRQTPRDRELDQIKDSDVMTILFEYDAGQRRTRSKKISRSKLRLKTS